MCNRSSRDCSRIISYVKPQKCEFHVSEVPFLRFIPREGQIQMDPKKTWTVQDWPNPKSVKEVQQVLGFAHFYCKFNKGFSSVAAPIYALTKKSGVIFGWSHKAEVAFQDLTLQFSSVPILVLPDPSQPFIVEIDASDMGMGQSSLSVPLMANCTLVPKFHIVWIPLSPGTKLAIMSCWQLR